MIQFPKNFLWGSATSAYQVEGNNVNCDWWEWEKKVNLKESSGLACRHYELYQQDFDLAKELNHKIHRLSIEWSRIQPEEGKFSKKEIDHYIDVILSLKERNLEPVVTLHHFTNPLWISRNGGWLNRKTVGFFLQYISTIVAALADKVKYWVTINEPLVYVYHSYIIGAWPPQEKSLWKAKVVQDNLFRVHVKAYRLIHSIYRQRVLPDCLVSIAKNIQAFQPCRNTLRDRFAVSLRDRSFNFEFIEGLLRNKSLDFIGINYYTRNLVEVEKWRFKNLLLDLCKNNHSQLKKNSMGWDIYPEGLYNLLIKLNRYNLPLFVLENGICTNDDSLRWDFISEHLKNIHRAMGQGVNVLGYTYWSLLDNFEWDKGFGPRFGLIEIDYNTYKRTIRESARKFALVCKTGILD